MCGATKGGPSLEGVDVKNQAIIQGVVSRDDQPVSGAYVRLLDQQNVKNYDGSWTEYGSLVGVPVAVGDEPGSA
jgi:hypothetical protein